MKKVPVLVALIFLAIGGALFYWGLHVYQKGAASQSWPTCDGRIVDSEVTTHHSTERRDGRTRTSKTFGAHILYDYEAEKQTYSNTAVTIMDYSSSDPAHARAIVNRYPADKKVKVYYDPADPSRSVLEPGVSFASYIIMGIGGIFCLVTVIILGIGIVMSVRGSQESSVEV